MSDLPPDLGRLRTIETYLLLQLQAVREAIRQAEQATQRRSTDAKRREQGQERARRSQQVVDELTDNRPEVFGDRPTHNPRAGLPDRDDVRWWKLQPTGSSADIGRHGPVLHRGDCLGHRGLPLLTRAEAIVALTDAQSDGTRTASPCPRCRPDLGLDIR